MSYPHRDADLQTMFQMDLLLMKKGEAMTDLGAYQNIYGLSEEVLTYLEDAWEFARVWNSKDSTFDQMDDAMATLGVSYGKLSQEDRAIASKWFMGQG